MNEKKDFNNTGFLSIDKPYLKVVPSLPYDEEYCKKTAFEMILERSFNHENDFALNFYGNKIKVKDFFKKVEDLSISYYNLGICENTNVSFFGLNTPEMVESLYALNKIGAITEWFNPNAMTPDLLRKHINDNHIEYLFIIDIMYDLVKEAIKGTSVQKIIVNSVLDSLPKDKGFAYFINNFGLDLFVQSDYMKKMSEIIYNSYESNKDELIKKLKFNEKIAFNILEYYHKNKTDLKTSYYNDGDNKDKFISWKDFLNYSKYSRGIYVPAFDLDKTSMVVHTGGTTGPIKRVLINDYAINSAPYQISLMPNSFEANDSFCQLVPPMVAWSLEGIHVARYFNMMSNLIATYNRDEFVKLMLKYKSNHYFTVPSFVKKLEEVDLSPNKSLDFVKSIYFGGEGISVPDERMVDNILSSHGSKCRCSLGYGQNEEFAGFSLNIDVPNREKIYGTCGIPLIGNDFIVYDIENKCELKYGKNIDGSHNVGELLVSGPSVMKGYAGSDSYLNNKVFITINGKTFLDTGDQVYADESGRICFCSREQRIIRTQDGKIFVNVIEDIINHIPEVKECCVVRAPNSQRVSEASCHIVLKNEFNELPEDKKNIIKNHIISIVNNKTSQMYTYYIPGSYYFYDHELPKTSFGKIDFKSLEEYSLQEYNNNNDLIRKRIKK
jgi:long-chain acyl-CoA synthetase